MLCDSLEQQSGAGVGGEIQEGGGACILTAGSRCCMAEAKTTL